MESSKEFPNTFFYKMCLESKNRSLDMKKKALTLQNKDPDFKFLLCEKFKNHFLNKMAFKI